MTIEELRARKQELLARLKKEMDLNEKGEGDTLALFMVREELADINDQIRRIAPPKIRTTSSSTRIQGGSLNNTAAAKMMEFSAWKREQSEQEAESESEQQKKTMQDVMRDLMANESEEARTQLQLRMDGYTIPEIAMMLGINRSSVSKTVYRATKRLTREANYIMGREKYNLTTADLSNSWLIQCIVLSLTTPQLVCFYLYYSERFSTEAIAKLLGVNRSSTYRTIRRALDKIDHILGDRGSVIIEHPEVIDEVAYQIYTQLESHPEMLPEGYKFNDYKHKDERFGKLLQEAPLDLPDEAVATLTQNTSLPTTPECEEHHTTTIKMAGRDALPLEPKKNHAYVYIPETGKYVESRVLIMQRPGRYHPPGKLLNLLRARFPNDDNCVVRWIYHIFNAIKSIYKRKENQKNGSRNIR